MIRAHAEVARNTNSAAEEWHRRHQEKYYVKYKMASEGQVLCYLSSGAIFV